MASRSRRRLLSDPGGRLEFRDLTADPADRALLRQFYERQYVAEFPDPDERESLENIERYLELRNRGWYGPNNYHVGLLLEDGAPIGGVIADYLAEPETGVLEFLVVASHRRGAGLGRKLLQWIETRLEQDANRAGRRLTGFAAELNDPFKMLEDDSLDPFARVQIWSDWGYTKLDFPYVQPALSERQKPVRHLLLAFKPHRTPARHVAAAHLRTLLYEYIRWAMRIADPARCNEFFEMDRYLDGHQSIGLTPLRRYLGEDPERPLHCHEIRAENDPDLSATIAAYAAAFPPDPTAVDVDELRHAVARRRGPEEGAYHLWALRHSPDAPVDGMASFFALSGVGFGGYIALGRTLRATGRLPLLIARIERRLVADRTGARGWYVEVERNSPVLERFRRVGFDELAVDYRQPALARCPPEAAAGVPLALLFKFFGARYGPPRLPTDEFLEHLAEIHRVVYRVPKPDTHPLYRAITDRAARWGAEVEFR